MDQGIIQSFKMKYRRAVVEKKLQAIKYGYEMPVIDVLSAIKKVNAAWKSVTSTTVRNCFRKADFKKIEDDEEPEEVMDKENDLEAKWAHNFQSVDFNQFMYVDSTLSSRCTLTDEQIAASARIEDEEDNDSDNDSDIIQCEPKITTKQAREWVDALRNFAFQSNSDSTNFEHALDDCMRYIEMQSSTRQSTIEMFVK